MKIIGIAGSMNPNSTTKKAVQIVLDAAQAAGTEVEMIHLADWNLPIYDDRKDRTTYPKQVHDFIQKVDEADGIVFGSPEYHGNLSGAVKNAIDFLEGRHLTNKKVAILGVSGGAMGANNTVTALHAIMRNLHAWPLPSSPSVPSAYMAFTEDGKLKDERLQQRLEGLGSDLVQYIHTMGTNKQA